MIETRSFRAAVLGVVVASAAAGAAAPPRTTIDLGGRDDSIRKLGMPGISIAVTAASPVDAETIRTELARELSKIVYTRALGPGEPGDYLLDVRLEPFMAAGNATTIRFSVTLTSAGGIELWRVAGRTEVEGAPPGAEALVSIGRNVVSALVHDGWVEARYDVNDPPPPPPSVRRE